MFQNYTSDNILTLGTVLSGLSSKSAIAESSVFTNAINYSAAGISGKGFLVNMLYDGTQDNVLLTIQASIGADAGNDFIGYVHTYAAASPITGGTPTLSATNATYVPFFTVNGSGLMEAKVLIPKLQLSAGENQYIILGFISPTSRTLNVAINAKLHLEDYRVFQPSK
ncbi:hypothetical protein [Vibrio phage vB_VpaM_PG19]|nr:hypothetical protein [Vibrio phage vB_VpaM_PG19]